MGEEVDISVCSQLETSVEFKSDLLGDVRPHKDRNQAVTTVQQTSISDYFLRGFLVFYNSTCDMIEDSPVRAEHVSIKLQSSYVSPIHSSSGLLDGDQPLDRHYTRLSDEHSITLASWVLPISPVLFFFSPPR